MIQLDEPEMPPAWALNFLQAVQMHTGTDSVLTELMLIYAGGTD